MILVRAPLRISFVGGGSDLPSYLAHGSPGHVVSATIEGSVYVSVQPAHDTRVRLHYRTVEDVPHAAQLRHDRAREALAHAGVAGGVEIHSIADEPAGSGLGSSSAFTVALLAALAVHRGQHLPAELLARAACQVELVQCGHPVGYQDAYASAYGGLNAFTFHQGGTVLREQLDVPAGLEARLSLVPVGGCHDASQILRAQGSSREALQRTRMLVEYAHDFELALRAGDLDAAGRVLNRSWKVKRALAPGITTPAIDALVEQAYSAGALGVKLCGAGGAGYLLVWAPATGLTAPLPGAQPVRLSHVGARVVYQSQDQPARRAPLVSRYAGGAL